MLSDQKRIPHVKMSTVVELYALQNGRWKYLLMTCDVQKYQKTKVGKDKGIFLRFNLWVPATLPAPARAAIIFISCK